MVFMKIFQKGFNYSQDGPGNRLVYHLQGCSFRCKWCANPESFTPDSPSAKDYSIAFLLDEAVRSKPMFFDGGGVTLTGGEPTVQYAEVKELLKGLHEKGIHTAIETNGSHPGFMELMEFIYYPIIDLKHFDNEKHEEWTGATNVQTINNIKSICSSGKNALIRIPLINGFNSNDSEGFAKFFDSLNTHNLTFEFLAYHEFGKDKWSTPYEVKDGFVSAEDLQRFNEVFKAHGLKVIKT